MAGASRPPSMEPGAARGQPSLRGAVGDHALYWVSARLAPAHPPRCLFHRTLNCALIGLGKAVAWEALVFGLVESYLIGLTHLLVSLTWRSTWRYGRVEPSYAGCEGAPVAGGEGLFRRSTAVFRPGATGKDCGASSSGAGFQGEPLGPRRREGVGRRSIEARLNRRRLRGPAGLRGSWNVPGGRTPRGQSPFPAPPARRPGTVLAPRSAPRASDRSWAGDIARW